MKGIKIKKLYIPFYTITRTHKLTFYVKYAIIKGEKLALTPFFILM